MSQHQARQGTERSLATNDTSMSSDDRSIRVRPALVRRQFVRQEFISIVNQWHDKYFEHESHKYSARIIVSLVIIAQHRTQ